MLLHLCCLWVIPAPFQRSTQLLVSVCWLGVSGSTASALCPPAWCGCDIRSRWRYFMCRWLNPLLKVQWGAGASPSYVSMQVLDRALVSKEVLLLLSPASSVVPKCNLAFALICIADEHTCCSSVTLFCCLQIRMKFLQPLISCITHVHPPDFWLMCMLYMHFTFSWQTQKLKLSRKK